MQILELELSNLDFYCPFTGEFICTEEKGYNEDAKSLIGYWVNEIRDQPFIKDKELQDKWDVFVETYENENDCFPDSEEIDDFFKSYDSEWIVFKICTYGMLGDIAWFILDKESAS